MRHQPLTSGHARDSLEDAEERVMEKYIEKYDLPECNTFKTFRENLNDEREIALSDLYDIETL